MRVDSLSVLFCLSCGLSAQEAERSKAQPNAMVVYRQAWDEVGRELDCEVHEITRYLAGVPPWDVEMPKKIFEGVVGGSAAGRERFAEAAALPSCALADPGEAADENPSCHRVMAVALLVNAHSSAVENLPVEQAVADAVALLRCSRHLRQVEHRDGFGMGLSIEVWGLRVLAPAIERLRADPSDGELIQRCVREFALHQKERRPIARVAESHERMADQILRQARLPENATDEDLDQYEEYVRARKRALSNVAAALAPLREKKLPSLAEAQRYDEAWTRRVREALEIDFDSASNAKKIEALAWLLASDAHVNLSWYVECELRYRELSDRVQLQLRELAKR